MSQTEKRRSPRAPVNRPGRLRVEDGPESNAQVIEVSEIGATVYFSKAIATGTAVELKFHLNIGMKTECLAYGTVRHYYVQNESHVVGLEFTHFDPHTLDTIRIFIRNKLQGS
jgi:hypothetical protein